jgi:hypothetical protein
VSCGGAQPGSSASSAPACSSGRTR